MEVKESEFIEEQRNITRKWTEVEIRFFFHYATQTPVFQN